MNEIIKETLIIIWGQVPLKRYNYKNTNSNHAQLGKNDQNDLQSDEPQPDGSAGDFWKKVAKGVAYIPDTERQLNNGKPVMITDCTDRSSKKP